MNCKELNLASFKVPPHNAGEDKSLLEAAIRFVVQI